MAPPSIDSQLDGHNDWTTWSRCCIDWSTSLEYAVSDLIGLNSRFGRGTIKLSGGDLQDAWGMRQECKSPDYTSDWAQVPQV